jgi:hypothetical protein
MIDRQEIEVAQSAAAVNAANSSIRALVHHRTGQLISRHQINYLAGLKNDAQISRDGRIHSHADALLNFLSTTESISYICLFAEKSTGLLTVPKKKRVKGIRCQVRQSGSTNVVDLDMEEHPLPRGDLDELSSYSESVRRALQVDDGTKILLAAAWVVDDEARLFRMFPEAMAGDVTMSTNAEKRPLFLWSGKDSNNHVFTALRAFLPSQCRWVFSWIWQYAIPTLHGKESLNRHRLTVTDGAVYEYSPLDDLCNKSTSIYANTIHMLCSWHLINQGMKHSVLLDRSRLSVQASAHSELITKWLHSWTYDVENDAELELSYKLLTLWLDGKEVCGVSTELNEQGTLGKAVVAKVKEFIAVSVWPLQSKILYSRRKSIRLFGLKTSSIVESESGFIKSKADGVKANQGIDMSCETMNQQANRRHQVRQPEAAAAHITLPTRALQDFEINLYKFLTPTAVDLVLTQYKEKDKYNIFRLNHLTFYIKRSASVNQPASLNQPAGYEMQLLPPSFEQTRIVSVMKQGDWETVVCTCEFYRQWGIPCRHTFKVMSNRSPDPFDVISRWHLLFVSSYLKDAQLTRIYDDAILNEKLGPKYSDEFATQWTIGMPGGESIEFFTSTLPTCKPQLRRNSRWRHLLGEVCGTRLGLDKEHLDQDDINSSLAAPPGVIQTCSLLQQQISL